MRQNSGIHGGDVYVDAFEATGNNNLCQCYVQSTQLL